MRLLTAVLRFCYDFVVGDDWKIAAGVLVALLAGAALSLAGVPGAVLAPVTAGLIAAAFLVALRLGAHHQP